jgi:transposase-like protein
MRCPAAHHRFIRTTNLLERVFGDSLSWPDSPGKRRTKVIPHCFTEKSWLKLVFATLWQTSQRLRGVRMTDLELQRLFQLRKELG